MNKQNTNPVSDSTVNKLVEASIISGNIVAEAAQKNAETAKARQIQTAQTALAQIDTQVASCVGIVREARKNERAAVDRLKNLAAAAETFKSTGDLRPFAEVLYNGDKYNVQNFLAQYPGLSK